jgi:type II secretory pathway component PulF
MFSIRLPVGALAEHCRGLRYYLEAGLTLAQAMKHQGEKGPAAIRPVAARLANRLGQGESFADALEPETPYFPPIYLTLANVAEEIGMLPEALRELEQYFQLQQRLWRDFISQITWPAFQFFMAVLVMTLLIYILGVLPENPVSVMGLKGERGAVIFLSIIGGVLIVVFGGYWFISNVVKKGGVIDRFLLKVPFLGRTLEALALARFALAMSISMEAGTRAGDAAKLSLDATSNGAFADRSVAVRNMIVVEKCSLAEALREQRLFPSDFLAMVETAEEGGREPDAFGRMAEQYNEIAAYRLKALTRAAAWLVWLLVAIFIIALIFNLFNQYLGALNAAGG